MFCVELLIGRREVLAVDGRISPQGLPCRERNQVCNVDISLYMSGFTLFFTPLEL